jgi:soluble lytic murein transglycosylase
MTIRISSAKTIPARWSKVGQLILAAVAFQAACFAATPSALGVLIHSYRDSPTPTRRAAIQTYIAAHPTDAPLANLALGISAYEQKDYTAAISLLVPIPAQLPKISDYAGYYLAASRVEASDFASVPADLAATHRNSPLNGASWVLEARARQSTGPAAAARLLADHYAELPQPEGDVVLGDCYRAAQDIPRATEAYRRVYTQYLTGDFASRAAAALTAMNQSMGSTAQLLHRADRQLETRDYAGARRAYQSLGATLTGIERDQALVRVGAADCLRGQYAIAMPYLEALQLPASEAEAERLYYLVECARHGKDDAAMSAALDRLAQNYRRSPFRLKALASAANRYLLVNQPADYVPLYRAIYQDFPAAPQAPLAHWKVAFQSYLSGGSDADALLREHLRNYFGHSTIGGSLYFLGRRFESSGDRSAARACYQRLAGSLENHYYAMLARDRLRAPEISGAPLPAANTGTAQFVASIKLGGAPPVPTDPTAATASRIERSRILRSAGLDDLADSELRYGSRNDGQPAVLAMEMASSAPAPYLGLKIMKAMNTDYLSLPIAAAPRQFWELLFPLPYKSDVVRAAEEQNLDPFLLAGLIRQESEFDPRALSPAKAYGLTQVRPDTGRTFARKAGIQRFTAGTLYQPAANLKIGASIFRSMLDRQGGSVEQTLAAYNAGPNRAAQWRTWANFREPAEFVESIPFTETRDYVQAVLRNAEMYRKLYK